MRTADSGSMRLLRYAWSVTTNVMHGTSNPVGTFSPGSLYSTFTSVFNSLTRKLSIESTRSVQKRTDYSKGRISSLRST